MKTYFAIVHKDADTAFGITFPDLPGCFSAADDQDDIVAKASEALDLWFEDEEAIDPTPALQLAMNHTNELAGGAFLIAVPYFETDSKPVRVNISLDRGTLAAIDSAADARKLTRSAFLIEAARKEILGAH